MAAAAEAAGLVNMVNLTYRNVPALQKARALIAGGEIGEVRHVEASYRQSWLVGNHWGDWQTSPMWLWRLSEAHGSKGVLGDVGIHILDFATFAVGMAPISLQARLEDLHKAPGDRIGDYPLDANDSAVMTLSFENGALGIIHASRFMTRLCQHAEARRLRHRRRDRNRSWLSLHHDPHVLGQRRPHPGVARCRLRAGADELPEIRCRGRQPAPMTSRPSAMRPICSACSIFASTSSPTARSASRRPDGA